MTALIVLFLASLWAGGQNALAGGGSFITPQKAPTCCTASTNSWNSTGLTM